MNENIRVNRVIQTNAEHISALCQRVGVRRLDVFGSATRPDFNPSASDFDFVVELDQTAPTQTAQAWFELKQGLETLFARPVDLLTAESLLNPYLRQRVESERQNVYAR